MGQYDFYSEFEIENPLDVVELTNGEGKFLEIKDKYSKIEILTRSLINGDLKPFAQTGALNRRLKNEYRNIEGKGGLKKIIHSSSDYDNYASQQFEIMKEIGLIQRDPLLDCLPKGSFFLKLKFTLERPFLSADDVSLYIIDNPVKKEKVFKVPMITPMSWKGNLRNTMVKIFLRDQVKLPNEEFAKERLNLSLLFGTEKGVEDDTSLAQYVRLLKPDAHLLYIKYLKNWFDCPEDNSVPHLAGRLRFFPTFFKKVDLMVINPHDRETKAGINPIYIEYVPPEATGVFQLSYTPLDLVGKRDVDIDNCVKRDMERISKGINKLFYEYGFSAKSTAGFGTVKPIKKEDILLVPESEELRSILIDSLGVSYE
jgi:CRISPR-associated protein Cmr2